MVAPIGTPGCPVAIRALTESLVVKLYVVSSLIPVHASEHVLGGVSEYLATALSLANPETSNALKAFLEDTERACSTVRTLSLIHI